MNARRRTILAVVLLGCGLSAQAALEHATRTERPELKAKLSSLPMQLGQWIGRDEPMRPDVLERTQASDYINRSYINPNHPGRRLMLWINYSTTGLNLRHSPEVCLPSGGWEKIEAQTRVLKIPRPEGQPPTLLTRLGYSQGDMVQGIGFWYYIFGEGAVERYVRSLPITSRSSHGRTTRGSGLTVEIFCPGESDPDGEAIRDFGTALLDAMEPILPSDRAAYFIP